MLESYWLGVNGRMTVTLSMSPLMHNSHGGGKEEAYAMICKLSQVIKGRKVPIYEDVYKGTCAKQLFLKTSLHFRKKDHENYKHILQGSSGQCRAVGREGSFIHSVSGNEPSIES